jgi:hypothetical protein
MSTSSYLTTISLRHDLDLKDFMATVTATPRREFSPMKQDPCGVLTMDDGPSCCVGRLLLWVDEYRTCRWVLWSRSPRTDGRSNGE